MARASALVLVLALVLLGGKPSGAQEGDRQALARELAGIMVDDTIKRGLDEQVTAGMIQSVATALQDRLNRRLQDVEWRVLSGIVRRFVTETFTPSRTEEIAAQSYARNFDATELRELLQFHRSPVGRKAARLSPVIAGETAQAIEGEI